METFIIELKWTFKWEYTAKLLLLLHNSVKKEVSVQWLNTARQLFVVLYVCCIMKVKFSCHCRVMFILTISSKHTSFSFTLKISWLLRWLYLCSSSSFDLRNVRNAEKGEEVSPSTCRTIFSSFVVSWQWKAGDERQLREVSYFNSFSLWEMKRSLQSAVCQRTETHKS